MFIQPSKFSKTILSEREDMIASARRRAQIDHENESAEELLKSTYQTEKARLKAASPERQHNTKTTSAPPLSAPKKSPSPMQKHLDLAQAMRAQSPIVLTQAHQAAGPTQDIDAAHALRVVRAWGDSGQAQKDFPNLAAFHLFCTEAEKIDATLPPHRRGLMGLAFYERDVLQKGRTRLGA